MKKSLLVLFVLALGSSAIAQIEKSTILVSASSNLGFTSYKPKFGNSESNFMLDGKVGYFGEKNFCVGLNVLFQTESSDVDRTAIGIAPFLRYYLKGRFFAGAAYTFANESIKTINSNSSITYGIIPMELGFAGFITPNIAIEPSLNYSILTKDRGSIFGAKVGLALYLNRSLD